MLARRPVRVSKQARVSLAEFSRSLISSQAQDHLEPAIRTAEDPGLENAEPKQFAAVVVAAMSAPGSDIND
jgi:hypothetical protein